MGFLFREFMEAENKLLLCMVAAIALFFGSAAGMAAYNLVHLQTITRIETIEKTCRSISP